MPRRPAIRRSGGPRLGRLLCIRRPPGPASLLHNCLDVNALPSVLLPLVLGSMLGCSVADATPTDADALGMGTGGADDRVLGKRAFDAASAGYATFERLGGEAPEHTLARATDQIDLLDRDLARMISDHDAEDVAALADVAVQLREIRGAIAAARDSADAEDRIDGVVSQLAEGQQAMDALRRRRLQLD